MESESGTHRFSPKWSLAGCQFKECMSVIQMRTSQPIHAQLNARFDERTFHIGTPVHHCMFATFSVCIEALLGVDYKSVEEIALEGEKAGCGSIWISDHFFQNAHAEGQTCMEPWAVHGALAGKPERIRLGTVGTCNVQEEQEVIS